MTKETMSLYIDLELKSKLQKAADIQRRSLNSYIINSLADNLDNGGNDTTKKTSNITKH